ncbi:MAG: hypothetical protein WDN26_21080 [Chitinophagaceae bacterium]
MPDFSLKNVGNKRIVVSWVNKFATVKQISIQRSFDSVRNFKTILTIADPSLPENGYLDTKADNDRMFYRLYILLDKGYYVFSNTKRPLFDTAAAKRGAMVKPDNPTLVQTIPTDNNSGPSISYKPKVEAWLPSKYVYTFKDGYIRITLPEDEKKYNIKFFTAEDELLFELKDVKEKSFKIDKANFYHAGWFKFELYQDGELKEKNKFYLPKEF